MIRLSTGGAASSDPHPRPSVGDQRSEGLRLQLVLPDATLVTQQLQLPKVQHVQVSGH